MMAVQMVLYFHGLEGHDPRKSQGASYKQLSDTSSVWRNRPKFLPVIVRNLWKHIQNTWLTLDSLKEMLAHAN